MSEGYFEAYRPSIPVKKSKTDIDESSDGYNTIEWLIKRKQWQGRFLGHFSARLLCYHDGRGGTPLH
jgi:hypothetical protein